MRSSNAGEDDATSYSQAPAPTVPNTPPRRVYESVLPGRGTIADMAKGAQTQFDQESLVSILAAAPDPVVITDDASVVVYANRAAQSFFGQGHTLAGLSAAKLFPQWFTLPAQCLDFRTPAVLGDGSERAVSLSLALARTTPFVAGVAIFRDATRQSAESARMIVQETELRALVQHQDENLIDGARILEMHLPCSRFEGLDVSWLFQPCQTLGGDMLTVHRYENQILLGLLDVSGHGIGASLLALGLTRGLSPARGGHVLGRRGLRAPKDVVSSLNSESGMLFESDLFATLIYGILDLTSGIFSFSCAGHPRPIRVRAGHAQEVKGDSGPPLGVDPAFKFRQSRTRLRPGDLLVLYTDGVTESRSPRGAFFGEERLLSFLAKTSSQENMAAKVGSELRRFRRGRLALDDVSVLTVTQP